MKNKEWMVHESIMDEYEINDRRIGLTIEEYSDNKGVLFTIEYAVYDEFDNRQYSKIIFKSRKEDTVRRMFKHYVDLLETMKKSIETYNKYYGDDINV